MRVHYDISCGTGCIDIMEWNLFKSDAGAETVQCESPCVCGSSPWARVSYIHSFVGQVMLFSSSRSFDFSFRLSLESLSTHSLFSRSGVLPLFTSSVSLDGHYQSLPKRSCKPFYPSCVFYKAFICNLHQNIQMFGWYKQLPSMFNIFASN